MIKDSGNRHTFATGAVRDMREGKGRCDLLPLTVVADYLEDAVVTHIADYQASHNMESLYRTLDDFALIREWDGPTMMLEVAIHFEEGAKKYGEYNWQKGVPVNCYLDSALRHYFKWRRGDVDEPHDRAFVWNILCCMWEIANHGIEGVDSE